MYPESPRHLLRRGAKRHRKKTAVISPEGTLTYGELADKTASLADILKGLGIGPGVQVALALHNSPAYLVTKEEEADIQFSATSLLADKEHPERMQKKVKK